VSFVSIAGHLFRLSLPVCATDLMHLARKPKSKLEEFENQSAAGSGLQT
jgi:hypothetical protein